MKMAYLSKSEKYYIAQIYLISPSLQPLQEDKVFRKSKTFLAKSILFLDAEREKKTMNNFLVRKPATNSLFTRLF